MSDEIFGEIFDMSKARSSAWIVVTCCDNLFQDIEFFRTEGEALERALDSIKPVDRGAAMSTLKFSRHIRGDDGRSVTVRAISTPVFPGKDD